MMIWDFACSASRIRDASELEDDPGRQYRQHGRKEPSAECACGEVAPVRYIFLKTYNTLFLHLPADCCYEWFKISEHTLKGRTMHGINCLFLVTIRVNFPQSLAVLNTARWPWLSFPVNGLRQQAAGSLLCKDGKKRATGGGGRLGEGKRRTRGI